MPKKVSLLPTPKKTPPITKMVKYHPEFIPIAHKAMTAGATLLELAYKFKVSRKTIINWMHDHPDFAKVIRIGGDVADNRVELTAFEKATGYVLEETIKNTEYDAEGNPVETVTTVERTLPPDNTMLMFWLKNRRGDRWKDKHEVTVNHKIEMLTNEQLQMLASEIIEGTAIEVNNEDLLMIETDDNSTEE